MRLLTAKRRLIAALMLWLTAASANAIPVQLNIMHTLIDSAGMQNAATGSFSQISPFAIDYSINTEFKFFVRDTALGTVTGLADSVLDTAGLGCSLDDFAGFQAGSIAIVGAGSCFFSDVVNNAFRAGAIGAIVSFDFPIETINFGLADPTFIPSIIASSTIIRPIVDQLALPAVAVAEPNALGILAIGSMLLLLSVRRRVFTA
jgi:hypothetical protein